MNRTLLLIVSIAFLASCNSTEEVIADAEPPQPPAQAEEILDETEVQEEPSDKPQAPYRLKAQIGDVSQRSDHYSITSARIEGNTLWIDVEYSGGCAWHTFELIGSAAVMKSLPPQRSIKLIHNNDEDMCEAWVKQTIQADISELAASQTSGSEIVLILDGYNEKLNFTFP